MMCQKVVTLGFFNRLYRVPFSNEVFNVIYHNLWGVGIICSTHILKLLSKENRALLIAEICQNQSTFSSYSMYL